MADFIADDNPKNAESAERLALQAVSALISAAFIPQSIHPMSAAQLMMGAAFLMLTHADEEAGKTVALYLAGKAERADADAAMLRIVTAYESGVAMMEAEGERLH